MEYLAEAPGLPLIELPFTDSAIRETPSKGIRMALFS